MVGTFGVHGKGRRPLVADRRRCLRGARSEAHGRHALGDAQLAQPGGAGENLVAGDAAQSSQNRDRRLSDSASAARVRIYTDGACKGNPGPGGWGALLQLNGRETELCGGETETTN